MDRLPNAQLTHLGLYVRDLDAMIAFYENMLGMVVTDRGPHPRGGSIAFLSRRSDEHHQLVLATGRPAESGYSPINQISFRVDALEDLQFFHRRFTGAGFAVRDTVSHGNAWSFYFADPEGNRIEFYAPSPWYVAQPCGVPIDLTRPTHELLEQTEAQVRSNPSFMPQSQWSGALEERIQERLAPRATTQQQEA